MTTTELLPIDFSGSWAADLHSVLAEAAAQGPLATDIATGATVVMRHGDVDTLAHDPRLEGIGLMLFDMMGIAEDRFAIGTPNSCSPPRATTTDAFDRSCHAHSRQGPSGLFV